MKTFIKRIDYLSIIKYSLIFLSFLTFNSLDKDVLPYSAAILITALAQGCSLIFTPLLFLASFLVFSKTGLLGTMAVASIIYCIIICIYRKLGKKINYEIVVYTFLGLLGFMIIGDTSILIEVEKRVFAVLITTALSFLSFVSAKALSEKGLKFKLGFEEFTSLATITAVFGLGICHFISPNFWKAISIIIVLTSCYVYRVGISTIISAVLGISTAVYYGDLSFVSIFIVYSIIAESLTPLSRHVASLAVFASDYILQLIFSVYPVYELNEFISILLATVIFCLLPTQILNSIKEKLYAFREKQLVRQTINRSRSILAGRLYDLSGVFTEMANAFNAFKKSGVSESNAKDAMLKEISISICRDCENRAKCKRHENVVSSGLNKMIDIGFAKGKLSLIDLPKELGGICLHPNNVIYGLNRLLADYRARLIENANVNSGRDLIAAEALGVAEILRGLALDSGTLLKYHNRIERALSENLFKAGILVSELLIYGENELISVSLITDVKQFSIMTIQKVISKTLGINVTLSEQSSITEEKCYLSFRKSNDYDAVFGIASAKKDGSNVSGDTHSVTRVGYDKFLLALSDGMGSGKDAENVSSVSLSLIESFYKAGLNGDLILNTVNRLLAVNTEDSFTALDVSVIDLKNCSADFIKYGSPYGFILSDNGIKIVEGSSLPLGIIDELKPSVASASLCDGDVILLITDGISDAFGSTGEIIDFLRTLTAKNPQTLADEVLNKAVEISGGRHDDDMTALAVRVYKRVS